MCEMVIASIKNNGDLFPIYFPSCYVLFLFISVDLQVISDVKQMIEDDTADVTKLNENELCG